MNTTRTLQFIRALSFAADKHRFQRRKDTEETPYINHPIHVALTLAEIGNEFDDDLLIAAILHDTIEDTQTSSKEIENIFGKKVLSLVQEVTDDKNLPKEERKRLQVAQASKKSELAKKLKLADKICNITDIIHHPPANWTMERKLNYLSWVEEIMVGLKGANVLLEDHLKNLIDEGRMKFAAEKNGE